MSENKDKSPQEKIVDLSQLADLQFATAWSPTSTSSEKRFGAKSFGEGRDSFSPRDKKPRRFENRDGREGGKRFESRDGAKTAAPREGGKRFDRPKPAGAPAPDGAKPAEGRRFEKSGERPARFDKNGPRRGFDSRKPMPFKFTMDVLFYPEDAPFAKLSSVIKRLKRTYQLFDIAELILEKPERFIVVAKNLPGEDGKTKPLYCAQPLNLPFEDEASAKKFAIDYYLNELFTKEKIEAEAPKGNFQVVNKCSITGDILGAPNWHRYNEFLREYHHEKFANMPFEKFTASIESSRDEAEISAWLESMKTREVYKLKEPKEGDPEIFETRENAANYVSRKFADALVKEYETVRLRGANVSLLPNGPIRRNMEEMLRSQRRFPIVTANNLRGRLRRTGFTIYKRGSKSFAFVSAVKRKFLFEGETLSELPQKIFDFIAAKPGVNGSALPYLFNSLEAPKVIEKPKSLAEEHKTEVEAAEAAAAEAAAAAPAATYTAEDLEKVRAVSSELRWLVSEGYVVEYADASLQSNPYMPRPKDKKAKDAHASEDGEEPVIPGDEPILQDKLAAAETDVASESEASDEELAKGSGIVPEVDSSSDVPACESCGEEAAKEEKAE